ncbi:MAG: metallophosphoesterase [Chitinophagaceae bacterium]
MNPNFLRKSLLIITLVISTSTGLRADSTYVKFGAAWKYFDMGTAAPSGSGAADWKHLSFNDASWNSGPAELGYGDNKERTTISYGGNPAGKYITTYFRKIVNIANVSSYNTVRLNAYIDDGAVMYVNGAEVARVNITGTPVYTTLASTAAENGNTLSVFDIPAANFITGNNIIAVEVHQDAANSADLSFDLEVIAKPGSSIFDYGAAWKYLDNGSNQGTAWRGSGFSDAGWASGNGELGYGETPPQATIISYGPSASNKYVTTYFRKSVSVNPGLYSSFSANIKRDDGCVVYVNGTEVFRSNIAAGAVGYTTTATNADDDGDTPQPFSIASSAFVNGSNVIAVEMHQANVTSSDLSFDMELDGILITPLPDAEPDISRGPLLQMLSSNAVTIRWSTTAANSSRVFYGSNETTLTAGIVNNANVTDHEMRIPGLAPDSRYYYSIGSVNSIMKGSYRNYFTTAPLAGSTRKIRIGVFGDPGTGNSIQKGSRDYYLSLKGSYNNAEMVIMLGDNAYNNGTEGEHNSGFFNIYNNNIFDNHAVFPVPGNHEYANDGSRAIDHNIPYYSIFTVPANGESGGLASGTEHYYSYNYGNIHFIMLDSYGIDAGNHLYDDTTSGQQAVWLKADLAANAGTHKWTVVCMHHPPYTNGTHFSNSETDLIAIRQKITPILERYGVDVVLAGHSHVYERSFLVKDHTGASGTFNNGTAAGGVQLSSSSARYDGSAGSAASVNAPVDSSAATTSCPYFTIDSVYKHGTVYVVAGSAGQVFSNVNPTYPIFYTRNQGASDGGEGGALYLEIQDNRLDAKFVGSIDGVVRDQFTIMKGVNKKTVINASINTPASLTASWVGAYTWYTVPFPPVVNMGSARTFSVTPTATGEYFYYVNDSINPGTTCLADTFTLRVTSALAVAVVNFEAVAKNKKVMVQWTTSQEVNSDYFTVERSANGRDFEMIMVISGKGDASTPTNYTFIDNEPLQGASYYRLIATDKNGDKKIVGIRVVNNKITGTFSMLVKPNPAVNNQVNAEIMSTKKQLLQVKILAVNGSAMYHKSMEVVYGSNQLKFTLPGGTYILSIEGPDNTKLTEKIIVQ